ncbi:MAG: MoaD/ThiS family protein [Candidatus Bipolaricaulia bacterium]
MIDVHLYGKLRRFALSQAADSDSIVHLPRRDGDTVSSVVARLGIPETELGANLFVDGHYATLESPVGDGARLGLFPDDMQLLYKWYFRPREADP